MTQARTPEEIQPALLTRTELAYLSGNISQLTNIQKSKLNYKIRMKLKVFCEIELPLLAREGFEAGLSSVSMANDKDCHSFDPGSNPGPGAFTFSNNLENTGKNYEKAKKILQACQATHRKK